MRKAKRSYRAIIGGVIGASVIPAVGVTAFLMANPRPPIKGWLPEYSQFVESKVSEMPEILNLPGSRMTFLIPSWGKQDHSQRAKSFSKMVRCMAQAESNFERLTVYRELGIPGKDSVTGLPIVSEGLLQLSYADKRNYGCDFDYESDKSAFLRDMKKSGQQFYGTDGRTILDPYKNLDCGIRIMRKLAVDQRYKTSSTRYAWGRYWAVMRPERPGYKRLSQCLKETL